MHVQVAGQSQYLLDDAGALDCLAVATRAHDDLGAAFGSGKGYERRRDVLVHYLLERTFELDGEFARERRVSVALLECPRIDDVHGEEFGARARSHPRGPSQQRFIGLGTRDCDDEALAGLPALFDVVIVKVLLERVLDPIGEPQERELAQRSQVA